MLGNCAQHSRLGFENSLYRELDATTQSWFSEKNLELVDSVSVRNNKNETRIAILHIKMIWFDAVDDEKVNSLILNFSGLWRHEGSLGANI